MREQPSPEQAAERRLNRLVDRAARRLPKSHRDHHREIWTRELHGMPAEARLDYAKGLPRAAQGILDELDPELAEIKTLTRPFLLGGLAIYGLGTLGILPALSHEIALGALYGVGVMLFTLLTTKCLMSLPAVRRVWWRLLALVVLSAFCALVMLCIFTLRSAFAPTSAPLLLAFMILGVQQARRLQRTYPPRTL